MKVVIKSPGKEPERKDIKNNLIVLQNIVGGLIEHVNIYKQGEEWFGMLCNEEGKLLRLDPNFKLYTDVICGTVIFVGHTEDDFGDLPEDAYELLLDPTQYKHGVSEWKVSSVTTGEKIFYRVYRLRDKDATDHGDNIETRGGFYDRPEDAERLAATLNEEGGKK
jgi:hypothetical protein